MRALLVNIRQRYRPATGHRPRTYRCISLMRNTHLLRPYSRTIPRVIWWSEGGGGYFLRARYPCKPSTPNPTQRGTARTAPWHAETLSSNTMFLSISSRESNPPQNRQLNISISNSEHQIDDFLGELSFCNSLVNTFCEVREQMGENGCC